MLFGLSQERLSVMRSICHFCRFSSFESSGLGWGITKSGFLNSVKVSLHVSKKRYGLPRPSTKSKYLIFGDGLGRPSETIQNLILMHKLIRIRNVSGSTFYTPVLNSV